MPSDQSWTSFSTTGELGMPIAIHSGDPRAFWQPVDDHNERADELQAHPGWALYGQPVPSFDGSSISWNAALRAIPDDFHFRPLRQLRGRPRPRRRDRCLSPAWIDTAARIPKWDAMTPTRCASSSRYRIGSCLARIWWKQQAGRCISSGPDAAPALLEQLFFSATHRFTSRRRAATSHARRRFRASGRISGLNLPRAILEKICHCKNAARLLGIYSALTAPAKRSAVSSPTCIQGYDLRSTGVSAAARIRCSVFKTHRSLALIFLLSLLGGCLFGGRVWQPAQSRSERRGRDGKDADDEAARADHLQRGRLHPSHSHVGGEPVSICASARYRIGW